MNEELICICCPMGCHLNVDVKNKRVSGNTCKRGEVYGLSEVINPVRVITSTVKIKEADFTVLPVKTKSGIPKKLSSEVMKVINSITVTAPIKCGDIIIKNILNTGIDLIATRSMEKVNI